MSWRVREDCVWMDAAIMACNGGMTPEDEEFLNTTLPTLQHIREVRVEVSSHHAHRNIVSINFICPIICRQVRFLPLLEKLEFDWGYTSLQPLQAFRSLLPNCRELCFRFALNEQTRLYEVATMDYLLPACNVEVLHFHHFYDYRVGYIRTPEDIRKLAASLSTYSPRLRTLRFSKHKWEHRDQISEAFFDLVKVCPGLRALEIRETNYENDQVYSTKIALELAKRRLHFDELVQNQLPLSTLAMVLSKETGESKQDEIAKRTLLFEFLQKGNPFLFPSKVSRNS